MRENGEAAGHNDRLRAAMEASNMRFAILLAAGVFGFTASAAIPSPEAKWKASLADDNKGWATAPHAILKIQDAAYLGEGQTATLVGTKGKPDSYRWIAGASKGVLSASVHGGHASVVKDGKTYSESQIAKGIAVDAGVDIAGGSTQVDAGVIGARIFVYNQQNADAKAFKGVDYFPYDPAYVVSAHFAPDPKLTPHAFRTSRGTTKQFFHAGDATFTLKGRNVTLPFYASDNAPGKIDSLSAFFMDGLTGKGAYGSGRYVDIDHFGAYPPKSVTIDFNYAYNPNCALSKFFTCPIALDSIAMEVKAGERDPHFAH
jgi:uncharacterized protein (DUF1684 family)